MHSAVNHLETDLAPPASKLTVLCSNCMYERVWSGLRLARHLTLLQLLLLTLTDTLTSPDDIEEGLSAEELVQQYMERVTANNF